MPVRLTLVGMFLCFATISCGGDDEEVTFTPAATVTVSLTTRVPPSPSPTTPPAPTSTPQPTAPLRSIRVPAGWKQFSTGGFSIWLPPSYEGGAPTSADFDLAIEGLKELGQYDLASTAELGRDRILLWLFDNDSELLGNNVNVLTLPAPSAIGMETVLEVNIQAVPFELVERSVTTVNGRESGRLLFDLQGSGLPAFSLQYYVRASSQIWVATFTCLQQTCDSQLEVFDLSACTILISE